MVTLKAFLLEMVSLLGKVSAQIQGISAMAGVPRLHGGREEAGRVPFTFGPRKQISGEMHSHRQRPLEGP